MAGFTRTVSIQPLERAAARAHDGPMFVVHCGGHGSSVLLWPANIEAIDNTASGPVVRWRCFCGARGTWSPGRRRQPEKAA
jgi:hypothetical protein